LYSDPDKRPTAEECLKHVWLKDAEAGSGAHKEGGDHDSAGGADSGGDDSD
jgi:hypothetical protein